MIKYSDLMDRLSKPISPGLRTMLSGSGGAVINTIVEATPSMAVIADADGDILYMSRYGCELSGWDAAEIEGLTIAEFIAKLKPSDVDGRILEEHETPLVRALQGERLVGFEGAYAHRNGERIPVVVNAAPFVARDGGVIGAINSATDVRKFRALERELRGALNEKALLYDEFSHSVKNHLQAMVGSIQLEARKAHVAMDLLSEHVTARVKMVAAIYEGMNQARVNGGIAARAFIEHVVRPYRTETATVDVTAPEQLMLSHREAGPLGSLINEAVCNSCKHAFSGRSGRIEVAVQELPGRLQLEITDNGVGCDLRGTSEPLSRGLRLMRLEAEQLGGVMVLQSKIGGGTRVLVTMPAAAASMAENETNEAANEFR